MKKRVIILVLTVLALLLAAVLLRFAVPYETQLKLVADCDQVLMEKGSAAILLEEDENVVSFVMVTRSFALGPLKVVHRADFDLSSRTLLEERAWFKSNDGTWSIEFAQKAREELYACRIYWDLVGGAPAHDFYMGISETEPTYELLGEGASELQYMEMDGLYVFMFLEACGG